MSKEDPEGPALTLRSRVDSRERFQRKVPEIRERFQGRDSRERFD